MNDDKKPLIKYGWLRVLLYLIAVVIAGTLAQFGGGFVSNYFTFNKESGITESLGSFATTTIVLALCIFAVTVLFRTIIDRRSVKSLGFEWKGYKNEAILGFFTGLALLGLGSIVLVIGGYLTFIGINFVAAPFILELVVLIVVALNEELIFRGYILHNLMSSVNKWIALIITALLFALFHAGNPGVNVFAIVNVFVAGLLLGINYIYTKNLWFSIFFHFAWNFFQGPVLGFDVSGLDVKSLFEQSLSGPELVTGGAFGFEGSALCAILMSLATLYFAFLFSKMYREQ